MKKGQSIIEVILAFAVMVLGLLAIVQIATRATANSGRAKRQSIAGGYAVAALEYLRNRKDTLGWDSFVSTYTNGVLGLRCYNGVDVEESVSCSLGGGVFTSRIELNVASVTPQPSGLPVQQITVKSVVEWQEDFGVASARQTMLFSRF